MGYGGYYSAVCSITNHRSAHTRPNHMPSSQLDSLTSCQGMPASPASTSHGHMPTSGAKLTTPGLTCGGYCSAPHFQLPGYPHTCPSLYSDRSYSFARTYTGHVGKPGLFGGVSGAPALCHTLPRAWRVQPADLARGSARASAAGQPLYWCRGTAWDRKLRFASASVGRTRPVAPMARGPRTH